MRNLIIVVLLVLTVGMTVDAKGFWDKDVHVLKGWLDGSNQSLDVVGTDSVLYVNLGSIPNGGYILGVEAYTLDAWNIAGNGGPADSVCVGSKTDIDAIMDEASCAAAGKDNTLVAASSIYNATQEQNYGLIRGYYRITSNGNYANAVGKTLFVVYWADTTVEP